MTVGVLLVAAALLVWPAGAAVQRLRGLSSEDMTASGPAGGGAPRRGGLAEARRIAERLPGPLILPPAAAVVGFVAFGPLHAGAAAVLAATAVDLRGRARRRRCALTGLGAWERALEDASSALRAGAGPGIALRRAATAAASVEATAHTGDSGSSAGVAAPTGRRGGKAVAEGRIASVLATAAAHADLGGNVAGALCTGRGEAAPDAAAFGLVGGTPASAAPTGADSEAAVVAAELAGAWLLATRHGVVLADAVDGLRTDVASRRARAVRVDSTLAGPRATAVILTGLPAFGVLLGSGFGADPLAVLLQGTLGGALCLAGAVFLAAGLLWTDRIAGGALG